MLNKCSLIFGMVFFSYSALGVWLGYNLQALGRDLAKPWREEMFESKRGRQLFRYDRIWRRYRVPVFFAVIAFAAAIC